MKKATDIAIVTPDGKAEVWVELPGKRIVFDRKGTTIYVADYTEHNVLKINLIIKKIECSPTTPA